MSMRVMTSLVKLFPWEFWQGWLGSAFGLCKPCRSDLLLHRLDAQVLLSDLRNLGLLGYVSCRLSDMAVRVDRGQICLSMFPAIG